MFIFGCALPSSALGGLQHFHGSSARREQSKNQSKNDGNSGNNVISEARASSLPSTQAELPRFKGRLVRYFTLQNPKSEPKLGMCYVSYLFRALTKKIVTGSGNLKGTAAVHQGYSYIKGTATSL